VVSTNGVILLIQIHPKPRSEVINDENLFVLVYILGFKGSGVVTRIRRGYAERVRVGRELMLR
jgi:hypothetical protein